VRKRGQEDKEREEIQRVVWECEAQEEEMIQRIKDKLEVPRSTPWPLPFKLI